MKKLSLIIAFLFYGLVTHAQYQFLGTYNSSGVPNYLDGRDNISASLSNNIAASLPENFPVPIYNPQLISAGYDNDIRLVDSADVWVTFVDEGAGYRNVLGFYTYDLNEPYTSRPLQSEITIIFPNISKVNSGGGLLPGDRVKIGTFSANTGIGWVLMGNGWTGSKVTPGLWELFSNPKFNPESIPEDRYHNVLLNDSENSLIVLGFEDIRRDYANCDQDFNDAIFYITANPIQAIVRDNIATITKSTSVSSGNDGGLESNGDLATAIAKRNHKRATDHSSENEKIDQMSIAEHAKFRTNNELQRLIPEFGISSDEEVRVSTPSDLKDLTNAVEVFAADYYQGENRTAVVLITETKASVYNHSKNICDRLNEGAVNDVRYVKFNGLNLMYAEISRDKNTKEYVSWFSVLDGKDYYESYSHWNIDEYPAGDYLNIQIWGVSPAHVFHKADYIINQLEQEKYLLAGNAEALPLVYVKSGSYVNGKLHLTLSNKSKISEVKLDAKIRETEQSGLIPFSTNIVLDGTTEQIVTVDLGTIFDAGLSLHSKRSSTVDNLYLADGSWGIDYAGTQSEILEFSISKQKDRENEVLANELLVERDFIARGTTSEVVNVFRNIKAGNGVLDISAYSTLNFEMSSNIPIEVVLVPTNLDDWSNRPRKLVSSTGGKSKLISLKLADFFDGATYQEIQSVVFSYINHSGKRESFSYQVNNLTFSNTLHILGTSLEEFAEDIKIYPNPIVNVTTISLSSDKAQRYQTILRNLEGKILKTSNGQLTLGSNEISYSRNGLSAGVYLFTIQFEDEKSFAKRVIIE
jgi:hypothetical protein